MADNDQDTNLSENVESTSTESRLEVFNRYPWLRWLIISILAVILILVIIFGVRAIHHHLSKSTPGTSQTSGKTSGSTSRPGSGGVAVVSGNGAKGSGSGSTIVVPSSGSSSTAKPSNSTNNSQANKSPASGPSLKSGQQLSNTGPGDVVAVFLAVTFAAASLHYLINLRREV